MVGYVLQRRIRFRFRGFYLSEFIHLRTSFRLDRTTTVSLVIKIFALTIKIPPIWPVVNYNWIYFCTFPDLCYVRTIYVLKIQLLNHYLQNKSLIFLSWGSELMLIMTVSSLLTFSSIPKYAAKFFLLVCKIMSMSNGRFPICFNVCIEIRTDEFLHNFLCSLSSSTGLLLIFAIRTQRANSLLNNKPR